MKNAIREGQTPLGTANVKVLNEQPVLATILRAGVPLHGDQWEGLAGCTRIPPEGRPTALKSRARLLLRPGR